jgi:hypothetical protein
LLPALLRGRLALDGGHAHGVDQLLEVPRTAVMINNASDH